MINEQIKRVDHKEYEIMNTIGQGAFSKVRLVKAKKAEQYSVVKMIKKIDIVKQSIQHTHFTNELQILNQPNLPNTQNQLNSQFFVKFEGLSYDERYIYLFMEFVQGGDLFTYLRKIERLDHQIASFYGACVIIMIEQLHYKKIVYRDLKPENILINEDGYLKLCDFTLSKKIISESGKTWTLCGTPEYLAPEILLNKGHGLGVDLWTFGVLIFEMHAGVDPFSDEDTLKVYKNILKGKVRFPKNFDLQKYSIDIKRNAKSLVKHLLVEDPQKRLGVMKDKVYQDLRNHRYFQRINWTLLHQRKLPAPYRPPVKGPQDITNFLQYPESDMMCPALKQEEDPFLNW